MKKFIILGLVVLFVFLSAQGLHEIKKPMRVLGWVKIGGDLLPIWTEKYDIGSENYWFDSSFIAHGWFKYLRVDSGGYLKLDSLDIDSLNISKLIGDYAYFDTLDADSIYSDHIVSAGQVDGDSLHGEHIVSAGQVDADSVHADHIVSDEQVDGDSIHGNHIVSDGQVSADSIEADHIVGTVDLIASDDLYVGDSSFLVGAVVCSSTVKIEGDLTVSGDVKPGVVIWNGLGTTYTTAFSTVASGANGASYVYFSGATSDTIIIDSMKCLFNTTHIDVYIDSVVLEEGPTKIANSSTEVWYNGTNIGAGTSGIQPHTYSSMDAKFAADWRPRLEFHVATSGEAGNCYTYTAILYCHYQ